jgi:hypothetical protein
MSSGGVRRGLRHLLGWQLLSTVGGEFPEASYQPARARQVLPFECPRTDCGGVKWAPRAPVCYGVGGWHAGETMEVIDPADAPADTPGLRTR